MPSAAGGVIDRSVGHSAYYPPFRSLLRQISFRKLLSAFRISANYQHPFQCGFLSGRPPARVSTASRIVIRPGASSDSRRACPKTAARRLWMWLVRSSCSVWLVTSALVTRWNQQILRMRRWHDMWNASRNAIFIQWQRYDTLCNVLLCTEK